jgi:sirohydrochlorin ferrochelatase
MYSVVGMARAISPYLTIEAGFMECNEPTIPMGVAHCVAAGAKRVVAIPYFLHMGTHVADDLPNLTAQARDRYPDVEFAMTGYLGESPLIADLLIKRARSAAHGPATEVVLGHAIG